LKLRLATTNVWFDKDKNKNERTEWHNVALWGNRAEALHRILTKGQKIMVEGRLETHSYEDPQGVTKYFTEVKARDIVLAGAPRRRVTDVPLPDMPDVMEAGRKTAPAVATA
ncbi:MAG: single-stranded DNA-binding protein, partial [Polyangiaceae bacterium]